jgi:hypothetical protein
MKVKINYDKLRSRCTQTEQEIVASLRGFTEIKGPRNSAYYKDNGARILAVAHMDTVQKDKYFGYLKLPQDSVIYSPYLDDRVGVYTILDLLPQLGIKCDVLLTTDEESCDSSAKLFQTNKKYNWLVEFDRMGEDVVTYGMDSSEFTGALTKSKFNIGMGSYSDISSMRTLGCCALNVGVGYHDCHSPNANMFVGEYVRNMKKFINFYHNNKDTHYAFDSISVSQQWWDEDYRNYKPYVQKGDRVLVNDLTGTEIHTDQQRCPDCGLYLDYMEDDTYTCWVCDRDWEYDYEKDKLTLVWSWEDEQNVGTNSR